MKQEEENDEMNAVVNETTGEMHEFADENNEVKIK